MAISEIVDPERPYPHFLPWKRISFFRGADQPPVFFRDMPEADVRFRELAAKHGIHLTSSFSTVEQLRDNGVHMNPRTALAIVTFVDASRPPEVGLRLREAIASLEKTSYAGPVILVDDGSTSDEHKAYLCVS